MKQSIVYLLLVVSLATAAEARPPFEIKVSRDAQIQRCAYQFAKALWLPVTSPHQTSEVVGTWTLSSGVKLPARGKAIWLDKEKKWVPSGAWTLESESAGLADPRQLYFVPQVQGNPGPYTGIRSHVVVTKDPFGELNLYTLQDGATILKREIMFGKRQQLVHDRSNVTWASLEESHALGGENPKIAIHDFENVRTTVDQTGVIQHWQILRQSLNKPYGPPQITLFPDSGPVDMLEALSVFSLHFRSGNLEKFGADALIPGDILRKFSNPNMQTGKSLAAGIEDALIHDREVDGVLKSTHGRIKKASSYSLDKLTAPQTFADQELTTFLYGSMEKRLQLKADKDKLKKLEPRLFILTDVDLRNPVHLNFISVMKRSAYNRPFLFLLIEREGESHANPMHPLRFANSLVTDPVISPFENIFKPHDDQLPAPVLFEDRPSEWTFDSGLHLMFPDGQVDVPSYETLP